MLARKLQPHIHFSFLFFILAAFFGLLYALQLLGYGTNLIRPDLSRSLHISLMLYGFVPLMMTLLPFALFEKEGVISPKAFYYLERFLWLWYIFLVFLIFSLLLGNIRGLPFYDFPYELNIILAFSGIYYILAIMECIKLYSIKPRWVNVSLFLVIISPIALLILMNPQYGQVEQMLKGPHGDNTLGMSFALVMIYYLAIKLASKHQSFQTKWHILWIIPLTFYLLSVLYRSFIGSLSYQAEWFLQYLTLLYVPLLYRWWKDAELTIKHNISLFISILAFLFADIEGNILFIPELREAFHRNDLVVGHAHIAVGIGLLFLALAIIKPFIHIPKNKKFYLVTILMLMSVVLSISGFEQAGFLPMHTELWWGFRALFGFLFVIGLISWSGLCKTLYTLATKQKEIGFFHLAGFLSDGLGGLLLILFGSSIYSLIGQTFQPGYIYIVFGFVLSTGIIHIFGLVHPALSDQMAQLTTIIRVIAAAGFFALYKSQLLGSIAILIMTTDLIFALIYLLYLKKRIKQ
jgi:hypothetical protein